MLPHLAAGNNVPLFSARTENDPPALTLAAAARALLSAQCWDTAAIKTGAFGDRQMKAGKTTGNPPGPLGHLGIVLPMGSTLFETIMLSVPVLPQGFTETDQPQWVGEVQGPNWRKAATPAGLLELLTWQARRIRLVPDADHPDSSVSSVILCAGDRLDHTPIDIEPHTAWTIIDRPKGGEQPRRPVRHQPGRSAWRGLATLLATAEPTSDRRSAPLALVQVASLREDGLLPEAFPLHALTVGVVYGNQQAVIDDIVSDVMPLPVQALLAHEDNLVRETLLRIVDQAEDLRQAANRLGDDLRAAAGVEKMPWDKGQRLGEQLVHNFTDPVRRILDGLQRQPGAIEEVELIWGLTAWRLALEIAEPAFEAAPLTAFLGRKQKESKSNAGYFNRVSSAESRYRGSLKKTLGDRVELDAALHALVDARRGRV